MSQILLWLRLHEALYPGVQVTNISQLFGGEVSKGYPYFLHEQFRMFGEDAGFDHSINEKYVFLDPPLLVDGGSIVLLSARPYPNQNRLQRYTLRKVGDDYQIGPWLEPLIQEHFRNAGRSIPQPAPTARPPAPDPNRFRSARTFWQGVRMSFSRLEWRGIPAERLPAINRGVITIVFFLILSALAYAFWPKVVVDIPCTEPFETPLIERSKVRQVTVWTVVLTALTTVWAMIPTIGGSETPYHIVLPYWVIASHWFNHSAGWLLLPLMLQIPVYGWIIGRAWTKNRLLRGVAVVTCLHVLGMLLSVIMPSK